MELKSFVQAACGDKFLEVGPEIEEIYKKISGFSSPRIMKLLNTACSLLWENEYYLEIGVMQGRTLIGALVNNPRAKAIAVDNFSEFVDPKTDPKEILSKNLKRYNVDKRVSFYNTPSQSFFNELGKDNKIGVYFYDGCHNTDIGYKALVDAVPFLAEQALIIIDDTSGTGVWKSVIQFCDKYIEYTSLAFAIATTGFPFPDKNWWNGVIVIGWNSNPSGISVTGG